MLPDSIKGAIDAVLKVGNGTCPYLVEVPASLMAEAEHYAKGRKHRGSLILEPIGDMAAPARRPAPTTQKELF